MKFFKSIIKLLIQFGCLALLLGLFGFIHPALDSFSHFRLHMAVIVLIASLFALFFKEYKLALIGTVIGGFCFYSSFEGMKLSAKTQNPDQARPVYTLFHFNLLWINSNKQEALEKMISLEPDIISVTETTRTWIKLLDKLKNRWPHTYMCRIRKSYGTKIYSKWPIVTGSEICLEYASYTKVRVIPPDGKPIDVLASHFRWPWPASGPKQLRKIKPYLQNIADDAIVVGDFNAVTWSWMLTDFAKTGGLKIFPGIGSTWMAYGNYFPFLIPYGLPLDNAMQKGRVNILSAKTLPYWGSDHLPVLVKFQLQ